MTDDRRKELYQDFHGGQQQRQAAKTRSTAAVVLDLLSEFMSPRSVLDVGCGIGTWLAVAKEKGLETTGIEGPWIDQSLLVVDSASIRIHDLEERFDLGKRFDLLICSEVAEHLSKDAAPRLIESLARHADVILFSAAIPFQGGFHHVNEQFIEYWIELFARSGYVPFDLFRMRLWSDERVIWWIRQNLVLFANDRAIQGNPRLAAAPRGAMSLVHPIVYLEKAQMARKHAFLSGQYEELVGHLKRNGKSQVVILSEGKMNITKMI